MKNNTAAAGKRWLFAQAKQTRKWIVLSIAAGFCGGLLLILQAHLLADAVDQVFMRNAGRNTLWPLLGGLIAVVLLRGLMNWARDITGHLAGTQIRAAVRMDMSRHLMSLGPAYTERKDTGALVSSVMEQVEALHGFFAYYLPQMALAVMLPIAIVTAVLPISWAVAAVFTLTAPLIPLFMVIVGMGAESISQRHFEALSRLSAHFLDLLQGLPTLKLFGRSKEMDASVMEASRAYRKRTMAVLRVAFLSSAVLEFFSSLAIALVAVYLGMRFLGYVDFGSYDAPLSFVQGFFILLLAPEFYWPLRELGKHYHTRADAIGATAEIASLLGTTHTPAIFAPLGETEPAALVLHNISFTYPGHKEMALNGLNLEVMAQERVALVGASGAGKSTLINLLLGFIRPQQGSIHVRFANGSELSAATWRRQIGWIGQTPYLFHGSIADNILMACPEATIQEVTQAAKNARALDFIEQLPQGINTIVGEHGWGLSRGQAQRVALARAFLKDAPLILLDEPTASMDAENESLVMAALHELSRNRTLLWVTHRLHHLKEADRILVMVDGCIAAQGHYDALLQTRGPFTALMNHCRKEGVC
jgi:ATP-binding cassette subfamily C protein CydD